MNCPACNATLNPSDQFCGECGAQTPAASASAPAPAIPLAPTASTGALRRFEGHLETVIGVVFSPDGREAFSVGKDKWMLRWDLESGRELGRFSVGSVEIAAFSSDGRHALTSSGYGSIQLWHLESGRELHQFETKGSVSALALSPDQLALVSGPENCLLLLDLDTGREVCRLEGHRQEPTCAAFSSDGRHAASGATESDYSDRTVLVWDLATGYELPRPHRQLMLASSVAFSPDGRRAAAGSMDCSVTVWEVDSGREVRRIEYAGNVFSVAFSPDGRRVLSGAGSDFFDAALRESLGGSDNNVHLWDLDQARELGPFEGHAGNVNAVAYSPDGRRVLSASADKTLRLWSL